MKVLSYTLIATCTIATATAAVPECVIDGVSGFCFGDGTCRIQILQLTPECQGDNSLNKTCDTDKGKGFCLAEKACSKLLSGVDPGCAA
ncbi:hypothetical protein LZ30DRAFT_82096 [Colletotrichum cereale]|nr:hypothetical protein LZ30DRAFT_82096 [Colletotrichum cereale]